MFGEAKYGYGRRITEGWRTFIMRSFTVNSLRLILLGWLIKRMKLPDILHMH
jgi:hypothetical protein